MPKSIIYLRQSDSQMVRYMHIEHLIYVCMLTTHSLTLQPIVCVLYRQGNFNEEDDESDSLQSLKYNT